jgi:hypothetical protein
MLNAQGARFCVMEHTTDRIALHKIGAILCNQPAGLLFNDAVFQMRERGERVAVSYTLGFDRVARLMRQVALWIILGVGLPTLLLVGGLVWYFVIPSQEPAVRAQVLQTLQIVHALWPPFLFLGILSLARRRSRMFVEQLIISLAHEVQESASEHAV